MILQQYKLFAFLSISLLFNHIKAQESSKYNITGKNITNEKMYIDVIKKKEFNSKEELNRQIAQELSKKGYYNFNILDYNVDSLSIKNQAIFNLEIDQGPQTFIRNIIIDSLKVEDSSAISGYFEFLSNEVFIESELEASIDLILSSLEDAGYPFAFVKIKSVSFDNDEDNNSIVDIYLKIEKELIRRINKVEINGNTKTKESVIINAARLTNDEIYSQKRIENIPVQLNKLRFFENLATPQYYINSKNEGILQIDIIEKNTNSFDGILGYVPSTQSGESGYLTGFVNVNLRNLFGTGRGAAIKWHQENSLTQELELKYLEPWIFNQPFNLNLQFYQRKQDSSYVKRIIGGTLEFLATENISASVIIESESIIPSINNTNQTILNSSSFNSGIKFTMDFRDDIYAPRSGTYFSSTYKYRAKNLANNQDLPVSISTNELEYHNYELDFSIFYTVFQNQVLALGIHAKEIIGDYFDISDFFQLGGTNSLRGYREKQFLGNRIIWSNLEYRFLLSPSSYIFTFFDSGYYLINENKEFNILRQSDFKNGYGFGISLETVLGIMRVSYAFAEGSSITNGLIHFGILNDF